jgi:prepilin-type N-terminal cleavage/methylation domain-containing protein
VTAVKEQKKRTIEALLKSAGRGFTLMELILVVLLMSILITFASVNWGVLSKKEAETFVEKFSIEVALLREDAIATYQQRAIQFDLTNNIISVGVMDLAQGFKALRSLDIPEGYMLKDVVINGEKISRGKREMKFYPTALVDKAIIHFDARTEFFSVMVQPLTAKVEARNVYVEEISLREWYNPS